MEKIRALAFITLSVALVIGAAVLAGFQGFELKTALLLLAATWIGLLIYWEFQTTWKETVIAGIIAVAIGIALTGWNTTFMEFVPFAVFFVVPPILIAWRKRIFDKSK